MTIRQLPIISRSAWLKYFLTYLSCFKLGHLDLAKEKTNFLSKSVCARPLIKTDLVLLANRFKPEKFFFNLLKNWIILKFRGCRPARCLTRGAREISSFPAPPRAPPLHTKPSST